MCISNLGPQSVLTRGRWAYKVTSATTRSPCNRLLQSGYSDKGKTFEYRIGRWVRSPMPATPGIYLYNTLYQGTDAFRYLWKATRLLRVWLPAGTIVRKSACNQKLVANQGRVVELLAKKTKKR